VLVDLSRLPTYAVAFADAPFGAREAWLAGWGGLCAVLGAWLALRRLRKVTIALVRATVAALMLVVGAALLTGLLGG
jgi:hypothetical protein